MKKNQILTPTRELDKGIIYQKTDDICPFCNKNNIVSRIYLEFNDGGNPCCNTCYNQADKFDDWFEQYQKISPISKFISLKHLYWFIQVFMRGYKPSEATNEILLSS